MGLMCIRFTITTVQRAEPSWGKTPPWRTTRCSLELGGCREAGLGRPSPYLSAAFCAPSCGRLFRGPRLLRWGQLLLSSHRGEVWSQQHEHRHHPQLGLAAWGGCANWVWRVHVRVKRYSGGYVLLWIHFLCSLLERRPKKKQFDFLQPALGSTICNISSFPEVLFCVTEIKDDFDPFCLKKLGRNKLTRSTIMLSPTLTPRYPIYPKHWLHRLN